MESLGLDLKLILAQIINFGLLVFVLSRFVYQPLIRLLDERKAKAEEILAKSKKIEEQLGALEDKEEEILKEAREKAREEREKLLLLASEEKKAIIEQARVAAAREAERGMARVSLAQAEAAEQLKKEFVKKVVEELMDKLTPRANKKDSYPWLDRILKE